MIRQVRRSEAFSLVEVTLALGVATFCLIAIFGLLPVGMQSNQQAVSQTAAVSILSSVIADLRTTPNANTTSLQYGVTFGTARTLYFDGEGRSVAATGNPRYRLTLTFPPAPTGSVQPTFVSLKVTWPAPVDPATNTPAGSVETFAALDRN